MHLNRDPRPLIRHTKLVVERDGLVRIVLAQPDNVRRVWVTLLRAFETARISCVFLVAEQLHKSPAVTDRATIFYGLEVGVDKLLSSLRRFSEESRRWNGCCGSARE